MVHHDLRDAAADVRIRVLRVDGLEKLPEETSMNKSLIDLALEKREQNELMILFEGELSEKFEAWLDEVETQLPVKVDHYHGILKFWESEAKRLRDEAAKFTDAARVLENAEERLKERMKVAMTIMGTNEMHGQRYSFQIVNPQARVIIENESVIPTKYTTVELVKKINKSQVRTDLEDGLDVPGAKLELVPYVKSTIRKGK
jgi:hypothetical protein